MRKVMMMVTLSGDRTHFIPGQEVEFEDEEAQRLVDANFAKFVGNEVVEESIDETQSDEVVTTKKKTSKK